MAVLLLIDDFWFPVIQIYNTISDKCVGNLLSARKHGFVAFEGEMLYQVMLNWINDFVMYVNNQTIRQRRDEDTEITLAKPIEEIVKLLPIVYDSTLPDNLQEW